MYLHVLSKYLLTAWFVSKYNQYYSPLEETTCLNLTTSVRVAYPLNLGLQ
jgi:hypothetical protein